MIYARHLFLKVFSLKHLHTWWLFYTVYPLIPLLRSTNKRFSLFHFPKLFSLQYIWLCGDRFLFCMFPLYHSRRDFVVNLCWYVKTCSSNLLKSYSRNIRAHVIVSFENRNFHQDHPLEKFFLLIRLFPVLKPTHDFRATRIPTHARTRPYSLSQRK